ncbi:MAG: hypothetical protein JKY56_17825 [Kofleriaceae bacterium]|nr:hypothetical protein [Kofleriaceae bacterium]
MGSRTHWKGNSEMLDLKAKLAAAGVVSAKQVEEFDEKEAKAKEEKSRRANERKKPQQSRHNSQRSGQPKRGGGSNSGGGSKQGGGANRGGGQFNKRGGSAKKKPSKTASDVETLKSLNKGEAYVRIRKVVEHSRLDDKEQTIPGVDDQTFNFVTAQGRISKLYVTVKTAKSLSDGNAAICAFMSHHGLSHCVLPKDIALDFAQVFPLWLRHLRGHEAAGQIEAPPEPEQEPESKPDKSAEVAQTSESGKVAEAVTSTEVAEGVSASDGIGK